MNESSVLYSQNTLSLTTSEGKKAIGRLRLTEDEELKWASLWSCVVLPGVEDKARIGPVLQRIA